MPDLREHIIDTALKLFLQKGFKEVTMKELIDSAGASKGGFYHHFTSKEQVFEEAVLSFYSAIKPIEYDSRSITSLRQFYNNWITLFFDTKARFGGALTDKKDLSPNHFYMLFDGIRLVPTFKEMLHKSQKRQAEEWCSIIDSAKKKGEIKSNLDSKEISKMFMYALDGLMLDLLSHSKISKLKTEALKMCDTIYEALKK